VCRVEQRIGSVVGGGLVDGGLVGKLLVDGEVGAAVGDGVFLEENGRSQGLNGVGNVLMIPGGVRSRPRDLCLVRRYSEKVQ
jgi:hypothetical protein